MASMLVSLLMAQKKRYTQSGSRGDPSFGETHNLVQMSTLSTTNNETLYNSSLFRQRSVPQQDMNLVGTARVAKERLDMKLRTKRKSDARRCPRTRDKNIENLGCVEGGSMLPRDMQMEVFCYKKRSILSRLCHKEFEHKECAICLEGFKAFENLLHLPCSHRFHMECLVPWLENNAHCPCCRMSIGNSIQAKR